MVWMTSSWTNQRARMWREVSHFTPAPPITGRHSVSSVTPRCLSSGAEQILLLLFGIFLSDGAGGTISADLIHQRTSLKSQQDAKILAQKMCCVWICFHGLQLHLYQLRLNWISAYSNYMLLHFQRETNIRDATASKTAKKWSVPEVIWVWGWRTLAGDRAVAGGGGANNASR